MPPKHFSFDESIFCRPCNITFASYDLYHNHKASSIQHITCDKCSMDFRTDAALKSHHGLQHPAEQRLHCRGCTKVFTRLGSLMSHIELGECSPVEKTRVEVAREVKEKWNINYRAARNNKDISRNSASAFEQPHPLVVFTAAASSMQAPSDRATVAVDTAEPTTVPDTSNVVFAKDDDLISFDEIGSILNSPWNDSHPLPKASSPSQMISTPIRSFAGLNTNETRSTVWDERDPGSPTFNASKYYVNVLRKYKCPKYPCNKSFDTVSRFVAHLKSPAHQTEKLQCHNCLRYFHSATALTQHCEAQGARCKVRETTGYNGIVDAVTGGTVHISGRHGDNTVKYVINKEEMGMAAVIDAHRAAKQAQEKKNDGYWTLEKLDNHKW